MMEDPQIIYMIDAQNGVTSRTGFNHSYSNNKPSVISKQNPTDGDDMVLINIHRTGMSGESKVGTSLDSTDKIEAVTVQRELSVCQTAVVVVRHKGSRHIKSRMPRLPNPQRYKINKAWRKPPPIPILTVSTGLDSVTLNFSSGIGVSSYNKYEAVACYELFACAIENGNDSESKFEKLHVFRIKAKERFMTLMCNIQNMDTGIEYYFALRSADVHGRCGPCAVEYAQL